MNSLFLSNGHDSSVETVAHPEPGQQPNDVQPTDTAKLDSDNVVSEPGVCSASVPGVREPNEQQELTPEEQELENQLRAQQKPD